jgi:hypothetical protein
VGSDTGHPVRGVLVARLVSVGLSALGLVALAYVVRASMGELLTDLGFWRLQQRRLWDVTNLLPGTDTGVTRHLWLLGLVPVAGLVLAGARRLARRSGGGSRLDPGRTLALGLCVVLLGLLQLCRSSS